ncbi:DUF4124 domain-containing protein [Pseudomonas sp. HR96]|uniref:DUF4124 domain-containing protein n=1 Tax=Pseudomonas sp. HR96 TaxID=1027966 RepID=UPI002A7583DA|nr:DUF4124 domain-containing protein [Pseudomonas sp. HR96]WPP00621.1 DUF4124 domain-containing protein [Pseudomonas sp. HR96]
MRSTAVSLTLLLTLSPIAMAGQVYKWTDASGTTHFDAQPPENRPSTVVPLVKPPPPPPPAKEPETPTIGPTGPDQKTIDRQVRKKVDDQEAKRKEFCTTERTNLAQLQNNPRVSMEINGQTVRLTEEQRQKQIKDAETQIAKECTK